MCLYCGIAFTAFILGLNSGMRPGFIFFVSSRRRHTSSYGEWSSDVCSSELEFADGVSDHALLVGERRVDVEEVEIGRAACRVRVMFSAGALRLRKIFKMS